MISKGCPFSTYCLSRRNFLAGAGAAFASYALATPTELLSGTVQSEPSAPTPTLPQPVAKVGLAFLHRTCDGPCWPHQGFDFEPQTKKVTDDLKEACTHTEFTVGTAVKAEQVESMVKQMDDVDGFVIYLVGNGVSPKPFLETGKPVVLVDYLYSGTPTFIFTYRDCVKAKRPVVGVASSDIRDVAKAARLFQVIKRIQSAKIVDVIDHDMSLERNGSSGVDNAELTRQTTGVEVLPVSLAELNSYYKGPTKKRPRSGRTSGREARKRWSSRPEPTSSNPAKCIWRIPL